MEPLSIRHLEPYDYPAVIRVVNTWWGGRNVADMLPRLFFVHFRQTSFAAECTGAVIGFLVGFVSPTRSQEAYLHFAGVHPEYRRHGVARTLYERFFEAAAKANCNLVRCVTSPANKDSIQFHLHMGFTIDDGDKQIDGVSVTENYDGRGGDRVLFSRVI